MTISYKGKTYASVAQMARLNNLSYGTLRGRLKKHDLDFDDLLLPNEEYHKKYDFHSNGSVTFQGKTYPSLTSLARAYNLRDGATLKNRLKLLTLDDKELVYSTKKYAKWLTTSEGKQKYLDRAKSMFPLTYHDHLFNSFNDIVEYSNIEEVTLAKRLVGSGLKNPNLFKIAKHPHKYKDLNIDNRQFKTAMAAIRYLSKKLNLSPSLIKSRVNTYGFDDPRTYYDKSRTIRFKVKIDGRWYFNVQDMSDQSGLSYNQITYRIQSKGLNNKHLLVSPENWHKLEMQGTTSPHIIHYQGHTFKSIRDMARFYNINPKTLAQRIEKYGLDYKYLISQHIPNDEIIRNNKPIDYITTDNKKLHFKSIVDCATYFNLEPYKVSYRLENNIPLELSSKEVRKSASHNTKIIKTKYLNNLNLLTAEQIAQQTKLNINLLLTILNSKYFKSYKVKLTTEQLQKAPLHHFNSGYKPEIVEAINDIFSNLNSKHLVLIPQVPNRYWFDTQDKCVYVLRSNMTLYKKVLTNNHISIALISGNKSSAKFSITEIESLLKHPEITSNDLVTIEQVTNYCKANKISVNSLRALPKYKRHNKNGYVVAGYYIKDLKKFIKTKKDE